jgi:GPI transamidase subunit PIG-U
MIGAESATRRAALPPGIFAILCVLALSTRVAAAFVFPNPEQDGYSYVETIARLSASLSAGTFRAADLFNFWLPLYQFASAIANLWAHNPLLVGKLLSAGCGAAGCVLVFGVVWELTQNRSIAWLSFGLVLCNPLHILYSAASMTDVPHACFILGSLYAVLRRRWVAAAIWMAIAEGIRIEAWAFVLVLPLLQLAYDRRVSPLVLLILVLPPLCSIGICQLATGNPLAIFERRELYIQSYLDFIPCRRGFTADDIQRDLDYYSLGANAVIQFAAFVAGASIIQRLIRREWVPSDLGMAAGYFFALLGFLFVAYITGRQPVVYPRYGLLFFVLGIPLLAWMLDSFSKVCESPPFRTLAAYGLIFLSVRESTRQLAVIHSSLENARAESAIARELQLTVNGDSSARPIFCDHASVRVLSQLPAQRFLRSNAVPPEAAASRQTFEGYLRKENVGYLVFTQMENSLPAKLLPQLRDSATASLPEFQRIDHEVPRPETEIFLYRFLPAGNDD